MHNSFHSIGFLCERGLRMGSLQNDQMNTSFHSIGFLCERGLDDKTVYEGVMSVVSIQLVSSAREDNVRYLSRCYLATR